MLIRSVLAVLALALLAIVWLATGPWWAEALDAIHTTRLATTSSVSIREFSGFFHFFPGRDGVRFPETEGFSSDDWGNPLELVGIRLEPGGTLVLTDGGRRFVLGKCPGVVVDHGYTPPIPPEPGDAVTITLDRGFASWPTPWHVTCCGSLGGGGSWYPWARYLYWHLMWIKRDWRAARYACPFPAKLGERDRLERSRRGEPCTPRHQPGTPVMDFCTIEGQ